MKQREMLIRHNATLKALSYEIREAIRSSAVTKEQKVQDYLFAAAMYRAVAQSFEDWVDAILDEGKAK